MIAALTLPNGDIVYCPEDPSFYGTGDRIPATQVGKDMGQVGVWSAQRPLFIGLQTVQTSIPNITWTLLPLQAEMIDNYAMHSTTVTSERVFPPFTGSRVNYGVNDFYFCVGYVPMSSAVTSQVFIAGIFNSQDGINYEGMKTQSATGHAIDPIVMDLLPILGDGNMGSIYASLEAWQSSGGAINTSVTGKAPSFTLQWVAMNRAYNTSFINSTPHTWIPEDQVSNGGGASPVPPGQQIDLNNEDFYPCALLNSVPMARANATGAIQTFATTGAFVSAQLPTTTIDLWGMWSSGANTKFTCMLAGLYHVTGYVSVAETTAKIGYRAVQIKQTAAIGGTVTLYGGTTAQAATGTVTTGVALYATDLIQLALGDTVEVQFANTNGTALSGNTGAGNASKLIAIWECL